jgi:SAM-dependent methyltransferase
VTEGGIWNAADAYERYVGRWSRGVAAAFLEWLAVPRGSSWADVGCGTGALTCAILTACDPASVRGVDASETFLLEARRRIVDPRARFERGDATSLPWSAASVDAAVSGLVLNLVADPDAMVREMRRVTRPDGVAAVYVWDYAGEMQMMRRFWDAAIEVSPGDAKLDQAEQYPLCRPDAMRELFSRAELRDVSVRAIDAPTVFADFDDYWTPFLGKTGVAPTYLASVGNDVRERIRRRLASRLAPDPNAPIELTARAWAVRGRV